MRTPILMLAALALLISSCSEYQKVLKSNDTQRKMEMAVDLYEKGKYNKAYPLFDELLSIFRGSSRAEDVYYYYAMTNYHLEDYILAAYHFKNFTKTFPSSENAEEAAFRTGQCYFLESPKYSLDQTYTHKAINELQLFINTHPESEYLPRCNEYIRELRGKLERKSFEKARQYYKIGHHQAAVVALNNTLNDFPGSAYQKEALYLRLKASYELASNSIESKKLQRFIESQTAFLDFIDKYPESDEAKEALAIYEDIKARIKQHKNQS